MDGDGQQIGLQHPVLSLTEQGHSLVGLALAQKDLGRGLVVAGLAGMQVNGPAVGSNSAQRISLVQPNYRQLGMRSAIRRRGLRPAAITAAVTRP